VLTVTCPSCDAVLVTDSDDVTREIEEHATTGPMWVCTIDGTEAHRCPVPQSEERAARRARAELIRRRARARAQAAALEAAQTRHLRVVRIYEF
jgi:hypothetical protein